MARHSEEEHPSVVIDRLMRNQPVPPQLDPRHERSAEHRKAAEELHAHQTKDHLLRREAWERTLAEETARLKALAENS